MERKSDLSIGIHIKKSWEDMIQIFHLTNETTSDRGRCSSSAGREPLKFIINKQKVKTLHCRVFLGSRLCAFGPHSSEKDLKFLS